MEKARLRLLELKNKNVIECLETLLDEAKKGKMQGLCFSVRYEPYHHIMGAVGAYETSPQCLLRVAEKLRCIASARIEAMETWE